MQAACRGFPTDFEQGSAFRTGGEYLKNMFGTVKKMFYENWLAYIKDEAKINKVAIPGTHNAGTMGMPRTARCQSGSLYKQYRFGIREFDLRLKTDRRGRLRVAHGISNGMPAEAVFQNLRDILAESNEFFILSIKTYQPQRLGPFTLRYNSNPGEINRLIEEYLEPEKYALTARDVSALTLGDIRRSGKKYIILNAGMEYVYSSDCELFGPWDRKVYGYKPEKFAAACLAYLRKLKTNGFFWLQTQQTPDVGAENGLKWPDKLDELLRPHFPKLIARIAREPALLAKANIIAGDFMTRDHMKVKEILSLNLAKGIVKEELQNEYARAIGKAPPCVCGGMDNE